MASVLSPLSSVLGFRLVHACDMLTGVRSFFFVATIFICLLASATTPEYVEIDPQTKKPLEKPKTLLEAGYPYVPQKTDYALELGVWQARDPSVWIGGLIGEHMGKCLFTQSQTCQMYFDFIAAAAVREAETYGLFLISPRWQYVNFPDRASTFFRVFGGLSAVNVAAERTYKPAGGIGIGVTTYLHENVDLRAEVRAGGVDQSFIVGLLSAHVKTDRLLEFFASKLKDLGFGTVETAIEATGTVFKATGEGVGGAIEGLKSSPSPTPSPKK